MVKKIKATTENIIILTLWITTSFSYSIALLNSYNLLLSDYLGLIGLTAVTLISVFQSKLIFKALMILLLFGTFNIVSFIYFVNMVFKFGALTMMTPGIQMFSLILILILSYKRASELNRMWTTMFDQTEEEIINQKESAKNSFKKKFISLSEKEIEKHLKNDLVDEAREALIEIQNERKNAL